MPNTLRTGVCKDWESYSTYGGPPLPRHFVRDAAAILENITKTGNTGKLSYIIDTFNEHVNNKDINPHGLDINQFKTAIVQELFLAYRRAGNVGTEDDMLKAIFSFVEVIDAADLALGDDTKAVNATRFKMDFDRHDASEKSHFGLFSRFMYKKVFPHDPVFSVNKFYLTTKYYEEHYLDGTKTLFNRALLQNELVQTKGTIVLDYNFYPVASSTTLVELSGDRGKTKIMLYPNGTLAIRQSGYAIDKEIVSFKLPDSEARLKVVLAFNYGELLGRGSLSELKTGIYDTEIFDYRTLSLPLFSKVGKGIPKVNSITYFNQVATTEEEMVFLLD